MDGLYVAYTCMYVNVQVYAMPVLCTHAALVNAFLWTLIVGTGSSRDGHIVRMHTSLFLCIQVYIVYFTMEYKYGKNMINICTLSALW